MTSLIKNPTSKFLRVRCKCKNEQVIFGKAATKEIRCLVCNEQLATSAGGATQVTAQVLERLG